VLSVGSRERWEEECATPNFNRKSIWDLRVFHRFYPAPDHHIRLFIVKKPTVLLFDDQNIVYDSGFVQCNILMIGMRSAHSQKCVTELVSHDTY
jgi:hypothetical protein